MKKLLIVLLFCFSLYPSLSWAGCSGSGLSWTCTANSTATEVNTAISNATSGATITFGAGTGTWATPVEIKKSLTIVGQTTGCPSSCIANGTRITGELDLVLPGDVTVDISQLTFVNNGIYLINTSSSAIRNLRIHHNEITGAAQAISNGSPVSGPIFGLIDHNKFTNTQGHAIKLYGGDAAEWASYPPSDANRGTVNSLYIEDNIFTGGTFSLGEGSGGMRMVFRYNTGDVTNTLQYIWDAHGIINNPNPNCDFEIYQNTITGYRVAGGQIMNWRGGGLVAFNNEMAGPTGGGAMWYWAIYLDDPNSTSCVYLPQNGYFWNNHNSVNNYTYGLWNYDASSCGGLSKNKAYWSDFNEDPDNRVDQVNVTTPYFGKNVKSSIPATCSVNAMYWATDEDLNGDGVGGVLYRCKTTNIWTKVYEPYTYPHPLGGEDTTAPVRSAILPQTEQTCDAESPVDITLSLNTTDATAPVTCKYCVDGVDGCNSSTTYASMATTFTNTASTSHSTVASLACNASYVVHIRCTDGTNANPTDATSSFNISPAGADGDAPTLSSVVLAADGRTLTLTFNESVKFGAGGNGGVTIAPTGGAATVSYTSGQYSTALVYTTSRIILSTETLTTTYTQPTNGIEDSAGNDKTTFNTQATTNNSTQTTIVGDARSLWAPGVTVGTDVGGAVAIVTGVRLSSSVAGVISAIRFYKNVLDTGTHTGSLWKTDGTLLSSVVFTGESASGWQQMSFATAIHIDAGTTYIASVHHPVGYWTSTANYFQSTGVTNAPLSSPVDGVGTENGMYAWSGTPVFPGIGSPSQRNYWVDIVFSQGQILNVSPPTGLGIISFTGSQTLSW